MSKRRSSERGRLRIGDDWNAITIIALSQTNPLKVIAEFVENSIDAQARHVTIIRGKEHNQQYLKVIDDGQGIPCTEAGIPDFKYVATHICDSLKRRLKEQGVHNIQGGESVYIRTLGWPMDKLLRSDFTLVKRIAQ